MFNSPQSTSQSTSAAAAMEFKSSGVLVSEGTLAEYDVLKAIGKGKFSVVYRASRKSDGRLVAVKKVAIVDIMDKKTREKTREGQGQAPALSLLPHAATRTRSLTRHGGY